MIVYSSVFLQHPIVGCYSLAEGGIHMIGNAKFFGGSFHNGTNGRVVDAADFWEEVVFDLEIESADIPAKKFIIAGKIGRSFHFMDEPVLINMGIFIRQRMFGLFNDVCELEDDSQDDSSNHMKGHEAD